MSDDDQQLNNALSRIADLQESLADLEQLTMEDRGWDRIIGENEQDSLTPEGRRRISDICEIMTIANPLIKRGFHLRHSYVWGAGHELSVPAGDLDTKNEVNAIVQEMFDDPRNNLSLTSEEAHEMMERWVYTHGAIVFLCDTDPDTGAVVVRQEDPDHIVDHISDPEDRRTVRFWRRDYVTREILKSGNMGKEKRVTVWHPDIDYMPTGADRLEKIGGKDVRWDQPLIIRCVNTPATSGWSWGIGDAYAAVAWARMSKEFLEAWFILMRALSRYAYRVSGKSGAAGKAMQAARQAQAAAGATAVMSPDATLEAVPKTGATIDASSAQPLQQFVAAALDVPLTMLLGDPGSTGARAVAETLDQPMELAMDARRRFWTGIFTRLAHHAIDSAIDSKSPRLKGEVKKLDGRRTVTLPVGWSRDVLVAWPDYDSVPVDTAMKALQDADQLDKLPPLLIVQLAMKYLDVDNPDEWLAKMTDSKGEFIYPGTEDLDVYRG